MQLDWTDANQLGVTIDGKPYPHKLCHSILPYSNAEWAVPCQSESTSSLIVGSQDAFREFGGVTVRLRDRPELDGHPPSSPTTARNAATTRYTWPCATISR